jgi:hypothetical protein
MLTIKAKYIEEVIGQFAVVRLFVATANANIVFMGRQNFLPIRRAFSEQGETTLADDDEGEEWKDR